MTKTPETENTHTKQVLVTECWPDDCLDGECEHRDEDGQPEDLEPVTHAENMRRTRKAALVELQREWQGDGR